MVLKIGFSLIVSTPSKNELLDVLLSEQLQFNSMYLGQQKYLNISILHDSVAFQFFGTK